MKEIACEARVENGTLVQDFLSAELERIDCPLKAQMQINVAVDEIFSNIAKFAYADSPTPGSVTVRVNWEPQSRSLEITLLDQGLPYNPLDNPEPDVTLSAEKRKIGGLGIFLARKMMDELVYTHENGCNQLSMIKKL